MYDHTDSINTTFRVLRSCKSLESLGNDALLAMISHSIETFSAALHDFDLTLPDYLHAGGQGRPKWVPMTCATVCLADNVSQFDMNEDDILSFLKHIHLLYRFDDFLETMPSQYAIEDLASISDIVVNAFAQFESASHFENTGPNSASTGSSFSVLDSGYGDSEGTNLAGSSFLKHDMLDLIRLLQQPAVQAASWYNQRWYHSELRQLLLAMVQQLSDNSAYKESRRSQQRTPSGNANLRMWLHTTGATSVGTKYQFAFLACLISARDQVPYLRGVEQRYLAQTFAQHVSASWRIWNDIGGRVRDEEEEALTSCIFADKSDIQSLMHLANFEAECAILAQTRLSDLKSDGSNHWRCLEFFRQAVQISGEIYMAGDPTRS